MTTACGGAWAFMPTPAAAPNQSLVAPLPGATMCTPGGIAFSSLPASVDGQSFSALVFGDCTGNWRAPAAGSAASAAAVAGVGAPARLARGRLVAVPIAAHRSRPVYALDATLVYDRAALRPLRARLVGRARGASLAFNPGDAGTARLAVASAAPIRADRRPLAVVVFEVLAPGRAAIPAASVRFAED